MNRKAIDRSHAFAHLTRAALCSVALAMLAMPMTAQAQTTLTGLNVLSTDSRGAAAGGNRWNTIGRDSIVSLFLANGAEMSAPFINGPTDAEAAISIPLAPGTHTFTIYGMGGVPYAHHSLNLFFNGNNTAPGISVFAPTQSSTAATGFSPNASPASQTLAGAVTPAANSVIYSDCNTRVRLTDFFYALPGVYASDRVGHVPFGYSYVGSDGQPDWVGQFTIEVTAVSTPFTNVVYVTNTVVVTNTVYVSTNLSLMSLRRGIKAARLQTPTARPLLAHVDQAQRALEQLGTRVERSMAGENAELAEDLQEWIDELIGRSLR